MFVARGVWVTLIGAKWTLLPPGWSNSRVPSPSSTGITQTSTSSSAPAARHCAATLAPSTLTYLSPAAARLGECRLEIADERDTGNRIGRRAVGQHELRAVPAAAERLTLAGLTLVRIVAAIRSAAREDRADLRDQLVDNGIGANVLGQPGHVAARPGDEPVERHRGRVEKLRHGGLDR